MVKRDNDPLDTTTEGLANTGKGSALTGGPNPGEPGHDGDPGDDTDLGSTHYSPEMGNVVTDETWPRQDEQ